MPKDFILVGLTGVVAGAFLFVLVFGAVFTGFVPALVLALAGYPVTAAVLTRWRETSLWLPATALVGPVLPVVTQFSLALLLEDGVRAALIWPAGAALVFLLSVLGSLTARRIHRRP